eukprot:g7866.t1
MDFDLLAVLERTCSALERDPRRSDRALSCLESKLRLQMKMFGEDNSVVSASRHRLVMDMNSRAMRLLAGGEAPACYEQLCRARSFADGAAAGARGTGSGGAAAAALRILTLNNLACYHRQRGGDEGVTAAFECLHAALRIAQEHANTTAAAAESASEAARAEAGADAGLGTGVSISGVATTRLHLCGLYHQQGRHARALEQAQAAVFHAQEELACAADASGDGGGGTAVAAEAGMGAGAGAGAEAETAVTAGEGGVCDSRSRRVTLAVAYHNLAVELEHTGRVDSSLPWYRRATAVLKDCREQCAELYGNFLRAGLDAEHKLGQQRERRRRRRSKRGGQHEPQTAGARNSSRGLRSQSLRSPPSATEPDLELELEPEPEQRPSALITRGARNREHRGRHRGERVRAGTRVGTNGAGEPVHAAWQQQPEQAREAAAPEVNSLSPLSSPAPQEGDAAWETSVADAERSWHASERGRENAHRRVRRHSHNPRKNHSAARHPRKHRSAVRGTASGVDGQQQLLQHQLLQHQLLLRQQRVLQQQQAQQQLLQRQQQEQQAAAEGKKEERARVLAKLVNAQNMAQEALRMLQTDMRVKEQRQRARRQRRKAAREAEAAAHARQRERVIDARRALPVPPALGLPVASEAKPKSEPEPKPKPEAEPEAEAASAAAQGAAAHRTAAARLRDQVVKSRHTAPAPRPAAAGVGAQWALSETLATALQLNAAADVLQGWARGALASREARRQHGRAHAAAMFAAVCWARGVRRAAEQGQLAELRRLAATKIQAACLHSLERRRELRAAVQRLAREHACATRIQVATLRWLPVRRKAVAARVLAAAAAARQRAQAERQNARAHAEARARASTAVAVAAAAATTIQAQWRARRVQRELQLLRSPAQAARAQRAQMARWARAAAATQIQAVARARVAQCRLAARLAHSRTHGRSVELAARQMKREHDSAVRIQVAALRWLRAHRQG